MANENQEQAAYIIKWDRFFARIHCTITGTDPERFVQMEDPEHIETVREIVDLKALYAYLKKHGIEHQKAWINQFEKNCNELLKYAASRFNRVHPKGLEYRIVGEYEEEIFFINNGRSKIFSPEEMKELPKVLKRLQAFYSDYEIRIRDYEANLRYRKVYFKIMEAIRDIPKKSLFIRISDDAKAYIFVSGIYKEKFDKALAAIDFDLESDAFDKDDEWDQDFLAFPVDYVYTRLPYYDFSDYSSITEAVYRNKYGVFVEEKAIMDAFEDDERIYILP